MSNFCWGHLTVVPARVAGSPAPAGLIKVPLPGRVIPPRLAHTFFPSVLVVVLTSAEPKDRTLKNVPTIQMLGLSCVEQENDLRFL